MQTTSFTVKDQNGATHIALRTTSLIKTGTLNDPRSSEESLPSYRLQGGERLNTKDHIKFVGVESRKEYTRE